MLIEDASQLGVGFCTRVCTVAGEGRAAKASVHGAKITERSRTLEGTGFEDRQLPQAASQGGERGRQPLAVSMMLAMGDNALSQVMFGSATSLRRASGRMKRIPSDSRRHRFALRCSGSGIVSSPGKQQGGPQGLDQPPRVSLYMERLEGRITQPCPPGCRPRRAGCNSRKAR